MVQGINLEGRRPVSLNHNTLIFKGPLSFMFIYRAVRTVPPQGA